MMMMTAFPLKLRSKWLTLFQTPQFRPISVYSASTVRAGEKSSISTNRKSTMRVPTSHRWIVYVTLKSPRMAHYAILLFLPVTFNFCRKKSAAKCVKTSRGKVVVTSFLYLTVHRWIAGEVHIYLKFALKVTHPVRKRRFRQTSLNSAAALRASEKSSIIANKKWIVRFPSSHRWTLCVILKSPKGWLKTRIFILGVIRYDTVD